MYDVNKYKTLQAKKYFIYTKIVLKRIIGYFTLIYSTNAITKRTCACYDLLHQVSLQVNHTFIKDFKTQINL